MSNTAEWVTAIGTIIQAFCNIALVVIALQATFYPDKIVNSYIQYYNKLNEQTENKNSQNYNPQNLQ